MSGVPKTIKLPAGDVFTLQELEAMYHAVFRDVTGTGVSAGPHTMVLGHKA